MNVTPERKAEQKIAARWGGNVVRLLKEKELKLCDLGRMLKPGTKTPTSDAFNLVRRHTMPDDKTCCTVASFLGVSKEALHHGELPDLPAHKPRRTATVALTQQAEPKAKPEPTADDDIIQKFVLFALKRKLRALDSVRRYALLQDVARLCIDTGDGDVQA